MIFSLLWIEQQTLETEKNIYTWYIHLVIITQVGFSFQNCRIFSKFKKNDLLFQFRNFYTTLSSTKHIIFWYHTILRNRILCTAAILLDVFSVWRGYRKMLKKKLKNGHVPWRYFLRAKLFKREKFSALYITKYCAIINHRIICGKSFAICSKNPWNLKKTKKTSRPWHNIYLCN